MLSGPSNLQCPTCGHVFMSTQTTPGALETCAHCAFVAPFTRFRVATQSLGAQPIRFQKRVPRLHEPLEGQLAAAPLPQSWQQAPPAHFHQPAQNTFQQPPTYQPPQQQLYTPPPQRLSPAPPAYQPASWPGLGTGGETGLPPEESAIEPKKTSSLGLWVTISLVFIAICGVTGKLVWEKIHERIRQLSVVQASDRANSASSHKRLVIPATRIDPMEKVNQRVLSGSVMGDAERLAQILFTSTTITDRLKAIASPAKYQAEVAAMFDENVAPPSFVALTPITNPPLSLVSGQRIPMYKVVTSKNSSGALLQMTNNEAGEKAVLWPLFRETHEGLLAKYITAKSREPKWFSVGLRRFHSFELPENARADFDAIDIDGSTDGSGHIVTFVAKESPLGRHFARHVEWEQFYYGRVLLSWMDIAGEMRPALLDCEGSSIPETK